MTTTPISDSYPNIKGCALEIAYDNGKINASCSEETFLAGIETYLSQDGITDEDLTSIEAWLKSLSPEHLEDLCIGEHSDILAIVASAPNALVGPDQLLLGEATHKMLNDFFELET